jgi:hypothetical protein
MTTECSICLEIISRKKIILTCNHVFHPKCIREWIQKKNTCPLCRAKNDLSMPKKTIQYHSLIKKIRETTIEFTDDIFEFCPDMITLRQYIDKAPQFWIQFNNYFEILEDGEKMEELAYLLLYHSSMKDLETLMVNQGLPITKKMQKLRIIKMLYTREDVQVSLLNYMNGYEDSGPDGYSTDELDYQQQIYD